MTDTLSRQRVDGRGIQTRVVLLVGIGILAALATLGIASWVGLTGLVAGSPPSGSCSRGRSPSTSTTSSRATWRSCRASPPPRS